MGSSRFFPQAPLFLALASAIVGTRAVHSQFPAGPLRSSVEFPGDEEGARLGASVATAGDGFSDLVVGAPGAGKAILYLGSADGIASDPALELASGTPGSSFGASVSTAGDVNGDGYQDVIVGAPEHESDGSALGAAFLYLGSATGLSDTASWSESGEQAAGNFGFAVAMAGDVNGDGLGDVIVSEPDYGAGGQGRVSLYLGTDEGSAGLEAEPEWTRDGDAGDRLDISVATAGDVNADVNADGLADVIIGSENSGDVEFRGRADLFLGTAEGLSSTAPWSVEGSSADPVEERFGHSLATAGDVNSDGFADFIVDSPFRSASESGKADLYETLVG